jgi:hypothetical protein
LADFEQVQAERLDFGQHAVQCRLVRRAGEHGAPPCCRGASAENAISTVAPR